MYVGLDGAPLWAHPDPLPPADFSAGGKSDPTRPGPSAAFRYLFASDSPVNAAYLAMLGMLAGRFGGDEHVLGLEIINEPYSLFEPDVLFAFYARAIAVVRQARADLPVFIEPSADRNIFDSATLPQALPFDAANVVYAPHLYTGVFATPWKLGDEARIATSVSAMETETTTLNMPLFVGEWGGPDDIARGRSWSDIAVSVFDKNAASWTNWSFDERSAKCADLGPGYCTAYFELVADASEPTGYRRNGYRRDAVELYARPYPIAVAGKLDGFSYDAASRTLTVNGTLHGTQDLSLPALTYPAGAQASCDGAPITSEVHEGFLRVVCNGGVLRLRPSP